MPDLTTTDALLRLVAASGLTAAVGLERELAAQPAGLRTHLLVGLGAGLFCVVGASVTGSDPTRVAAQVVTGVGFLGAGAILHNGAGVKGLTTAASLWVAAAIGLACGLGSLVVATAATVIALVALVGLRALEVNIFPHRRGHVVELEVTAEADLARVMVEATAVFGVPAHLQAALCAADGSTRLVLISSLARGYSRLDLVLQLRAVAGVTGVQLGA